MALAMLSDFGPSARRDMRSSVDASRAAVDGYMEATPRVALVDNYVNNPGAPDLVTRGKKEAAADRLTACNRWSLLVRSRVAADAVGVVLMLRGSVHLGAAFVLAAHGTFWGAGAAAARLDRSANPSPLSPPLARLVGGVAFALSIAAALGGVGWRPWPREACGLAFGVGLTTVELARLIADRARARTHVGL